MSYKRTRRSTVQLTSLLDLLFVMIFVSLIQQKQLAGTPKAPTPTVKKVPEKQAPDPRPQADPAPRQHSVSATFHFYPTDSNPNIPEGRFLMQGRFNSKDKKLQLAGLSWINRPKNYDMVPLSGTINPKIGVFRGRIDFQSCQNFTLKRSKKVPGSPIAGTWKGSYQCGQGETGLTLQID